MLSNRFDWDSVTINVALLVVMNPDQFKLS